MLSGRVKVLRLLLDNRGRYFHRYRRRGAGDGERRGRLGVLNSQVMNLLHVHFEMIRPLEHLSARLAGVWYKPSLVLVPDVAQQGTLEVENSGAHRALELWPVRCLAHAVDRVGVGQPLQPGLARGGTGGSAGRGRGGVRLLVVILPH